MNDIVERRLAAKKQDFEYPKEIYLDGYTYTQMYEHEKGGMYYHSGECIDVIIGLFISLYPDGRLTYLWNGYEHEYGKYDFENNKKIGDENI